MWASRHPLKLEFLNENQKKNIPDSIERDREPFVDARFRFNYPGVSCRYL